MRFFLSQFAVTRLPYFVAAAALLSFPASQLVRPSIRALRSPAGRSLRVWARWIVVPDGLVADDVAPARGCGTLVLPVVDRRLAGDLRLLVSAQRTIQSSSGERADGPCGGGRHVREGLLGGIGAERVAVLLSASALLPILAAVGFAKLVGVLLVTLRRANPPGFDRAAVGGTRPVRDPAIAAAE